MSRIYINTRQTEESRIIVVDDDNNLIAFEQELVRSGKHQDDLYKGVGFQSGKQLRCYFCDLGIGKNGFLPFREVSPAYGHLSPATAFWCKLKKTTPAAKGRD